MLEVNDFNAIRISLASPEKIRFQYRLDGVDGVWLDAEATRTAVYTSIPVGVHSFHIRACNSDGVWDRAGIVYRSGTIRRSCGMRNRPTSPNAGSHRTRKQVSPFGHP